MISSKLIDKINSEFPTFPEECTVISDNCTLIIMHPKTWDLIVKESIELEQAALITPLIQSLTFNNIPVYRSKDIKEGKFILK